MNVKFFEIRDRGTFIPALAITISGASSWLARRAGFGDPLIILIHLEGMRFQDDPYAWGDRTMRTAHPYIAAQWNTLPSGRLVDVEFILRETDAPKMSEAGLQ